VRDFPKSRISSTGVRHIAQGIFLAFTQIALFISS